MTLSHDKADDMRRRIQSIVSKGNISALHFEVGEILYHISVNQDQVRRWGFASWGEWVESDLGIGQRQAQQLRSSYRWFAIAHPLPSLLLTRLRRLPWTTVRLLVGKVTADNAAQWIEIAGSKTRKELEELLRDESMSESQVASLPSAADESTALDCPTDRSEEVWKIRRFRLAHVQGDDASQHAIVGQALERASELSGSDKEGHNLTLICMDFLVNNDFRLASDPNMRLRYLAKLEDLLGISFVGVDRQSFQIMYGSNLLVDLVKKKGI